MFITLIAQSCLNSFLKLLHIYECYWYLQLHVENYFEITHVINKYCFEFKVWWNFQTSYLFQIYAERRRRTSENMWIQKS
jgi:hypothetical protein